MRTPPSIRRLLVSLFLGVFLSLCSEATTRSHCEVALRGLVPETEPVQALILANSDNFEPTVAVHQALMEHGSPGARIIILAPPGLASSDRVEEAVATAADAGTVKVIKTRVAGNWIRDYGPQLVKDAKGKFSLVRFGYRHPNLADSDKSAALAAKAISKELGIPLVTSSLDMQWGALFVDGKNRLFISEAMTDYTKGVTMPELEAELRRVLHVGEIHWLPPLPKEQTRHLDLYVKYMGGDTLLLASSDNPERRSMLAEMAVRFKDLGFTVKRVKMVDGVAAEYTALSYTNSVVVNGKAFIPSFADKRDRQDPDFLKLKKRDDEAVAVYRSLGFRKKDIVQVPSRSVMNFGGAVHCLTCQINDPSASTPK